MRGSEARRPAGEASPPGPPAHAIWGSELSPFALKLRSLCDFAGIRYAWLPAEGGRGTLGVRRQDVLEPPSNDGVLALAQPFFELHQTMLSKNRQFAVRIRRNP